MGIMLSPKLRLSAPGVYTYYCPGCRSLHQIYTSECERSKVHWNFNGNVDKPTFSPSVRHWYNKYLVDDATFKQMRERINAGEQLTIPYVEATACHYFITDGKIIYQNDCEHSLAGQTVEFEDFPEGYFSG